jgi:hypothetical protein
MFLSSVVGSLHGSFYNKLPDFHFLFQAGIGVVGIHPFSLEHNSDSELRQQQNLKQGYACLKLKVRYS